MIAKFEADSTFIILGRGLVLAGWVIDGRVKPGMTLSISSFPKPLIIQGIEHIARAPSTKLREGMIGLRFSLLTDAENLLWKNLDVNEKILEIYDGKLSD
jgi:hypothetical protein